jgi:divalent metal cation (Fe/Co/Zn/Cd) transporter
MQPFPIISILIFVLLIVGSLIAVVLARKTNAGLDPMDRKKHPQGYWMSVGISMGVAIGVAFGPIFDNIGVGIGIGIAIGTAIGASLEQKYKDNTRPLTEEERNRRKWASVIGLAVSVVLGVILIIVFLLQAR